MKQALAAAGRDTSSINIAPAVYAIVAESASMAEDKRAYIDSLSKPVDGLNLLCEVLNTDFSKEPLDEPFSDEELAAITGWRGFCDRVIMLSGKKNPSVRDFVSLLRSREGLQRQHVAGKPRSQEAGNRRLASLSPGGMINHRCIFRSV